MELLMVSGANSLRGDVGGPLQRRRARGGDPAARGVPGLPRAARVAQVPGLRPLPQRGPHGEPPGGARHVHAAARGGGERGAQVVGRGVT